MFSAIPIIAVIFLGLSFRSFLERKLILAGLCDPSSIIRGFLCMISYLQGSSVKSVLAIIFSRPLVNKLMKKPSRPANVDALLNQKAFVLEEIKPTKFGRVKIEGEEWLAESSEEIPKGGQVKIIEVKGVRLIVKKAG